jgi:hypothetical protein
MVGDVGGRLWERAERPDSTRLGPICQRGWRHVDGLEANRGWRSLEFGEHVTQ